MLTSVRWRSPRDVTGPNPDILNTLVDQVTTVVQKTPGAVDVNGDGVVTVVDVQLEVNMALGISPCTNPSGTCNVVSVQRVVNAALGGQCVTQ